MKQTLSFLFFNLFFFVRIFDSLSGVAGPCICHLIIYFVSNAESDDSLSFIPLIPTYSLCVISDTSYPALRETTTTLFLGNCAPLFCLTLRSLSAKVVFRAISISLSSCPTIQFVFQSVVKVVWFDGYRNMCLYDFFYLCLLFEHKKYQFLTDTFAKI